MKILQKCHYSSFFCCSSRFSRGFTEHSKVSEHLAGTSDKKTAYNYHNISCNPLITLHLYFLLTKNNLSGPVESSSYSKWFGQCANQILQESLLHLPTNFYCISRADTEWNGSNLKLVWLLTSFVWKLADSSSSFVHTGTMDGSALVKDSRATNCQSGRAQTTRITSNKDDRLGLITHLCWSCHLWATL